MLPASTKSDLPVIPNNRGARNFLMPLGGGDEIGASCYWLSVDGANILIDAGMRFDDKRAFSDLGPLYQQLGSPQHLDAFLLTHAHLDHSAAVGKIQYEAPHVPKFATGPTITLTNAMLSDAVRVSKKRAASEDFGLSELQFGLVHEAIEAFTRIEYHQPIQLPGKEVIITPFPAGHILGACSYRIETPRHRILVTGDICLHGQRTIPGADLTGVGPIDVLISESTYAYQPVKVDTGIEEQQYNLVRQVVSVVEKGGRALIPAFALGRAQEIACLFSDQFEQGLIQPFPIYMDGLVRTISDLYNEHRDQLQGQARTRPGHAIYSQYVQPTPLDSYPTPGKVASLPPCCIIASSGMLLSRTRSSLYAQEMLPNPQDSVIFSGYLDAESPGALVSRAEEQTVTLNARRILRRATISRYHLSAHSNSNELRQIMEMISPRTTILVHGDYHYTGDPDFLAYLMAREKAGMHTHQSKNGTPIYF